MDLELALQSLELALQSLEWRSWPSGCDPGIGSPEGGSRIPDPCEAVRATRIV